MAPERDLQPGENTQQMLSRFTKITACLVSGDERATARRAVDLQMAWLTAFAPAADQRNYRYNSAGFAQVTSLWPISPYPSFISDQGLVLVVAKENLLQLDPHWRSVSAVCGQMIVSRVDERLA